MDKEKDNSTEQKILESASEIFHEKGYDGTRMQEIADKANINKGLLHYYFKTKDALFESIFRLAFNKMITQIQSILLRDMSLEEKTDLMVDEYMSMLSRNSFLPQFVLNELNKNPDKFVARHVGENMKATFAVFSRSVEKEIESGRIRPIDPRQLFMNLISLIIFPYVGRAMIQVVIGLDKKQFQQLMNERKSHIKSFIRQSIASESSANGGRRTHNK